jgi:predicted ATPase
MRLLGLRLRNWRNFRRVAVRLTPRTFVVGPNASGKSNLLEALRFLRDVAHDGGGLQSAVGALGGVSRIRSLHARGKSSAVGVAVDLELDGRIWTYELEFKQDPQQRPLVQREIVQVDDREVLVRPDKEDEADEGRLGQTHLEQRNANREFRDLARALSGIRYLHLVPHLIREPERALRREHDPYGSDFLDQLATLQQRNVKAFKGHLSRLNRALRIAVPQLENLHIDRDARGLPHLKAGFKHWRPNAGAQTEAQFSDGTLRLIGLLWSVLDGDGPVLLEEPELSLHPALVRILPAVLAEVTAKPKGAERQILISTHSADLLSDPSIGTADVLMLEPTKDGTVVAPASSKESVRALVDAGLPVGDAVLPAVAPKDVEQLLFEFGA